MAGMQGLAAMKAKIEKIAGEVQANQKDIAKAVNGVNQLQGQLAENSLVKQELDQLEEGAKIYKLVGPVLIPQDVSEAKSTVETRIKYISKECSSAKTKVEKLEKTQQERRMSLLQEQQKFQSAVQQSAMALNK